MKFCFVDEISENIEIHLLRERYQQVHKEKIGITIVLTIK